MVNQKAISARLDYRLYVMVRDYATMHCTTTNRLINRALEHYLLYQQYKYTSVHEYMTFDEYYDRKNRHENRPSHSWTEYL